jgi:hypothetical protein
MRASDARSTWPVLARLAGYRPGWITGDVAAGLAIAAVGLPTAIAYPAIAGLPPETDLYASIAPLVAYAVFVPSRQLIVGPDAATIPVMAVLAAMPPLDAADRPAVAALLALIVGGAYLGGRVLGFLDVSEEEQERRFRQRIDDPVRQWQLSAMDVESYRRWLDYTRAHDEMIPATASPHAPWWIVDSTDKKAARINCLTHALPQIPYKKVRFDPPKLGRRQKRPDDYEPDQTARNVVPAVF